VQALSAREYHLERGAGSCWTVETATDWIWARSHLTTWQHLVGERGWALDDYRERSIRSILAEILARPAG
jgi:hypothetical protein